MPSRSNTDPSRAAPTCQSRPPNACSGSTMTNLPSDRSNRFASCRHASRAAGVPHIERLITTKSASPPGSPVDALLPRSPPFTPWRSTPITRATCRSRRGGDSRRRPDCIDASRHRGTRSASVGPGEHMRACCVCSCLRAGHMTEADAANLVIESWKGVGRIAGRTWC